jgi:hypothetical protein
MRHNRAVKKLITRIGGFRPWSDKDFDNNTQEDEAPKTELIEKDEEQGEEDGSREE